MSSLAQDLDDFIFFGGEFPDLAQDFQEVPLPKGFYVCMECKQVTNYWPPGEVCGRCEAEGERQMEMGRGN